MKNVPEIDSELDKQVKNQRKKEYRTKLTKSIEHLNAMKVHLRPVMTNYQSIIVVWGSIVRKFKRFH